MRISSLKLYKGVDFIASGIRPPYQEVYDYFKNKGYLLLEKDYKNAKQKLKCSDEYGYIYLINYSNLQWNKIPQPVSYFNPYSIQNIKRYISINNLNIELLSTEYFSNTQKLLFRCLKCNSIFENDWSHFKEKNKILCNQCSLIQKGLSRRVSSNDAYQEFLNAGYIINKDEYECTEGKIVCRTFDGYKGIFTLRELRYGNRFLYFSIYNPFTIENIKNYIYLNKLDCVLISKKFVEANKHKLHFKCACGNDFYVSWTNFQNRLNHMCNDCIQISSLERKTKDYLDENLIKYEREYPIFNGDSKHILRFDFRIEYNNRIYMIECDGIGHFEPIEYWGGIDGFKDQMRRDQLKNEYCLNNNIPLLRIPYWDFKHNTNYKKSIKDFLKN